MATDKVKIIYTGKGKPHHTQQDNLEVIKPFVQFSWKAVKILAGALISIVAAVIALRPSKHSTEIEKR